MNTPEPITRTRTLYPLLGRVFKRVEALRNCPTFYDSIIFTPEDSLQPRIVMEHYQECCEQVRIEDIDGPLSVLEGSAIVQAEETAKVVRDADEQRWTFYRLATAKGGVTVRWMGESNGYCSVGVSVLRIMAMERRQG